MDCDNPCRVFRLKATNTDDEPKRPDIDMVDNRNQAPAWERLREILILRVRPVEDYIPIEAHVIHRRASEWNAYHSSFDFFSAELAEAIERICPGAVRFLPAKINQHPFFVPFFEQPLDVLDVSESDVSRNPGDPESNSVFYWVFRHELIPDPALFMVPETFHTQRQILMSRSVAIQIHQLKLKGVDIFCAEGFDRVSPQWKRRPIEDVPLH